jgi:hypothetical protein
MKIDIRQKFFRIESRLKLKVSKGLSHLNLTIDEFLDIPVVWETNNVHHILGNASFRDGHTWIKYVVGYSGYPDYEDEDGSYWNDDKLVRCEIDRWEEEMVQR